MNKTISKLLREGLMGQGVPELKTTPGIVNFVSQFETDELLLRAGGLPIDLLDRAAHGFSEEDVTTIHPDKLRVRWKDDYENVVWEMEQSGLGPQGYASQIDLSEPIDVDYWEDKKLEFKLGFYIQDGHHRYYAAKVLGKMLNVKLEIKVNPINILGQGLSYDDYHRTLFHQIKRNG